MQDLEDLEQLRRIACIGGIFIARSDPARTMFKSLQFEPDFCVFRHEAPMGTIAAAAQTLGLCVFEFSGSRLCRFVDMPALRAWLVCDDPKVTYAWTGRVGWVHSAEGAHLAIQQSGARHGP